MGSPRSALVQTSASVPPTKLTAVEPAIPLRGQEVRVGLLGGESTHETNRMTSIRAMLGARAWGMKSSAKTIAEAR